MAMTRSTFSLNLLVEGLREVFFDQYDEKSLVGPKVYKMEKSKKRKETLHSVTGIGMLAEKTEGEPITYQDFADGYEKDFVHTSYAKGLRFSRELIDDMMYGVLSNRTKKLARAARYRKEWDLAKLFNNATATTYFTGQDGLALLSSSHTYAIGSGTWSNTGGAVDLSLSTLETAFLAMRKYKDDNQLLINIEPKYLLIPPDLEFDAYEILKSTGKPYTADNEVNYFKGKLEVIVWPFLTDTDVWFILGDDSDLMPVCYDRTPLEFNNDSDFDTMDVKVSAYTRYSNGFFDPRFCYGGTG